MLDFLFDSHFVLQPLRIFILLVWVIALITYFFQIKEHPKEVWNERFWYSFALISYILHVIVFYIVVVFVSPVPGNPAFTLWSTVLRIHGGFAILFKEITAIVLLRLRRGIK